MSETRNSRIYGVVAEFSSAEGILHAARRVHEAGYRRVEAYTPFMVEGLCELVGFERSRLPAVFLIGGIVGALTGFFMCYYAFTVSLPINIGGRPHNSWPAWIPITFEMTVLFSACAGAFGMLIRNGLPRLHHPIFDTPDFARATRDRFFLSVEAADATFDEAAVTRLLASLAPEAVSVVHESGRARLVVGPPRLMAGLLLAVMAVGALAAGGCEPNSDMYNEPRYSTYAASDQFSDGTSARPIPEGTIDRAGFVHGEDQATLMGHVGSWSDALPATTPWPFAITSNDLTRGQQLFDIYCAPCHSRIGDGNGMVPQRGFPSPPSFHSDRLRHAPPAYFVDVITHGIGAMYSYSDRVQPDDRWRIAAYIRALQLSQQAPLSDLDAADRAALSRSAASEPAAEGVR